MRTKIANFRLTAELLEALDVARFALRKPTLTALVREALELYLAEHEREIRACRRLQRRNATVHQEARP